MQGVLQTKYDHELFLKQMKLEILFAFFKKCISIFINDGTMIVEANKTKFFGLTYSVSNH